MKAASIDLCIDVALVVFTGHAVYLRDQPMQARAQLLHGRHQARGVTGLERGFGIQLPR